MGPIRIVVSSSRALGAAAALFAACAGAAWAQAPTPAATAMPTPAPTPAPPFTARAHASVTIGASHVPYATAQFAVAQRGALTRIDLLSITSDFAIPKLMATVVIDHGNNTATSWSDTTRLYYVQKFVPTAMPSIMPRPAASAAPRAGASFLKNLDVLSMSFKLTGHGTTAGIASSGLLFEADVAAHGSTSPLHLTSTLQLADDYAFFPLALDAAFGHASGAPSATIAYAVDTISFTPPPPPSQFVVPTGYKLARSLFDVLGFPSRRPATMAPQPQGTTAPH